MSPVKGSLQSLQVGETIYSIFPVTKDRRHDWRVEHYPLGYPTSIGRFSLGTRISSAQFITKKNEQGQITLITLTVKIAAATGGTQAEREFVLAAHPRT
jgi:hypothetical protein